VIVTASFIPQLYKTYKTKKTTDISMRWMLILGFGQILYTIYGFLANSMPVILSSGIGFLFLAILFVFKLKYEYKML